MMRDAFNPADKWAIALTALLLTAMLIAYGRIDWANAKQAAQIVACSMFGRL